MYVFLVFVFYFSFTVWEFRRTSCQFGKFLTGLLYSHSKSKYTEICFFLLHSIIKSNLLLVLLFLSFRMEK